MFSFYFHYTCNYIFFGKYNILNLVSLKQSLLKKMLLEPSVTLLFYKKSKVYLQIFWKPFYRLQFDFRWIKKYTCLYCTKNWQLAYTGLFRNDRFMLHLSVYITLTNTPWYVSSSPGYPGETACRARSGNSNGIAVVPTGILPGGASSILVLIRLIGCKIMVSCVHTNFS